MSPRLILAAAAAVAASALALPAQAAEVKLKDMVARVVVIPEARDDIDVQVAGATPGLPALTISRADSDVTVDGGLGSRIRGCRGARVQISELPLHPPRSLVVDIAGAGQAALADAPVITIRTPLDVHVSASGAVFGAIGRADSVSLGNSGCGDWNVADARGMLAVGQAGSGDVHAGSAASAKVSIAGSGDIFVGRVGDLKAEIGGSGDVTAASVSGQVTASIAGSGDVRVKGGPVRDVRASIAGPGDVYIDAAVGSVEATVVGSGEVHVASASGPVKKAVMGSGGVVIGR